MHRLPSALPAVAKSPKQAYVIDGYNFMALFSPEDSQGTSLEERRTQLLEALSNHAGRKGIEIYVVFDGVPTVAPETIAPPHVKVIFSEQAHGADQVIERLVREISESTSTYVVTGDYLQQQMVFGKNIFRKPPRELMQELAGAPKHQQRPAQRSSKPGYRFEDLLGDEALKELRTRIHGKKRKKLESDEEAD